MSTRVEAVTLQLREMIIAQELQPGSRVPERDLAEAFGVSRTPVRVALSILEAEGLVTSEPNRGFVVNGFSIEDVLSAFDVRGALEGLAARTAVERGLGDDALATLQACVAEGGRWWPAACAGPTTCGAGRRRTTSSTGRSWTRPG
jgi:GntR family transcriptional regulator of vanillate catabolism